MVTFFYIQQTYMPDLILAISGRRGSQKRGEEEGLGQGAVYREKGLPVGESLLSRENAIGISRPSGARFS